MAEAGSLILKIFLLILFSMVPLLPVGGQDVELPVRSLTANGRIHVIAEKPETLPMFSVWSKRALEKLEQQWKLKVPFQVNHPLKLQIRDMDRDVHLHQGFSNGSFLQTITLPESFGSEGAQPLAQTFVDAMLSRLLQSGQHPPGLENSPPEISWANGAAVQLMERGERHVAMQAVGRYADRPPPTPEVVREDDVISSYILYRWMRDTLLSNRQRASTFWTTFELNPQFSPGDWISVTPDVMTLRDLHMAWEVWWLAERRTMISEFQLTDQMESWLMEELNPVPRFLGVDAQDAPSHQTTSFSEYEVFLNHPRAESAFVKWMMRLHAVRFRQSAHYNSKVLAFEKALQPAIKAARARPADQQAYWNEAVRLWNEAISRF